MTAQEEARLARLRELVSNALAAPRRVGKNGRMAKQAPGCCERCGRVTTRSGMTRHLKACLGEGTRLLLSIRSPRGPWWLHVTASPLASLLDLDELLRANWLECCGHMSAFEIGGMRYEPYPQDDGWGPPARSMRARLADVLSPRSKLSYTYDFGSSTHLTAEVVATVGGGREATAVVASNAAIPWPCVQCGQVADTICSVCQECACGCTKRCPGCDELIEELGLPVVNSPRMGVCSYTGV